MDSVIAWLAQYLLFVLVAFFGVIWLAVDRRAKLDLIAEAAFGSLLMLGLIYLAASLHHDPRPFVQNPTIKPLFAHNGDDGFPSDHSAAAGLLTGLVATRSRLLGAVFAVGAVVIAWARVAAHVHHLQDVVAGLLLGGLAAAIAWFAVATTRRWLTRQTSAHPASAR